MTAPHSNEQPPGATLRNTQAAWHRCTGAVLREHRICSGCMSLTFACLGCMRSCSLGQKQVDDPLQPGAAADQMHAAWACMANTWPSHSPHMRAHAAWTASRSLCLSRAVVEGSRPRKALNTCARDRDREKGCVRLRQAPPPHTWPRHCPQAHPSEPCILIGEVATLTSREGPARYRMPQPDKTIFPTLPTRRSPNRTHVQGCHRAAQGQHGVAEAPPCLSHCGLVVQASVLKGTKGIGRQHLGPPVAVVVAVGRTGEGGSA